MTRLATREQLRLLWDNPYGLIERLKIVDDQGQERCLDEPHVEQIAALEDFKAPHVKMVIDLKSRQMGLSTVALADEFDYLTRTPDPVKCLYVGDVDDTTDSSFLKIQRFHEKLPNLLQRPLARNNRREFTFEDTGAGLKCMTAGGRSRGKGWTFQRAIFDEFGFWPNAEEAYGSFTSAMHAGPHKMLKIISTPNGPGNKFHQMCMAAHRTMKSYPSMRAYLDESPVRFRFFAWHKHFAYRRHPPKRWEPSQDEARLMEQYGLDILQLYWRHWKIHSEGGIGLDQFRMQYPINVNEGFLQTSGMWFNNEYLNKCFEWARPTTSDLVVFEKPESNVNYAVGIDPSWANGGDYFVVQVLSEDGRQVCRYSTNKGGEDAASQEAAAIARYYNNARVLAEGNPGGAGRTVLHVLRKAGCKMWWRPPVPGRKPSKTKRPWTTGKGNKEMAYGHFRQVVNGDVLQLNDYLTVEEMTNIRRDPGSGRIEAHVGHDDHAMALCLAEWNRRTLPSRRSRVRVGPRKPESKSPLMALARMEKRGAY